MRTPVAFFIFNRPDLTARVFTEISKIKPSTLLVIGDGPRTGRPDDEEKCTSARAVIDRIDWECEVLANYSEANLGCGIRITTGMDWIFALTEEAIILEDDCLPHPSFFAYCEELLEKYRSDERVMMISGTNLLVEWKSAIQSYQFSLYGGNGGWATWRRAWAFNDHKMELWPKVLEMRSLEAILPDDKQRAYWETIFQRVYEGEIDTWDYQWLLACWMQNGLRIFPETNLISNIGFRADATHTTGDHPMANLPTKKISLPLKHPPFMMRNAEADKLLQEKFYSPRPTLISRLKRRVLAR